MKKELEDWKNKYNEVDITDMELHHAINKGIQKAKRQNRYKWWSIFPVMTAAIILISAITFINTVPAFATELSKLPGMDRFVKLVQFDKGQQAAIENDYFQVIDKTKTKGDLSFILEGVIRDSNGMVLFYTVSSEKEINRVRLDKVSITNSEGKKLNDYIQSEYAPMKDNQSDKYSQTIGIYTKKAIPYDEFTFSADVVGVETLENGVGNQLREKIAIDFHAENTKEAIQYQVDKTISIKDQQIHINSVTIQPLRTTIDIHADSENSMRILSIDDMALVDETGEEWASIQNGSVASGSIEEENYEVYLQSNYFEQPEELQLTFSKIQAVDRDKDYLRFDLKNEIVLHDPYNVFYDMEYEHDWLSIALYTRDDFYMDPLGDVYDMNGNKIMQPFPHGSHTSDGRTETFSKAIQTDKQIIDVKLNAYPHWIEKKVEIPLK